MTDKPAYGLCTLTKCRTLISEHGKFCKGDKPRRLEGDALSWALTTPQLKVVLYRADNSLFKAESPKPVAPASVTMLEAPSDDSWEPDADELAAMLAEERESEGAPEPKAADSKASLAAEPVEPEPKEWKATDSKASLAAALDSRLSEKTDLESTTKKELIAALKDWDRINAKV